MPPPNFISYLKSSPKSLSTSGPKTLVLGNESCDLDSAVSSLTYAYFLAYKSEFKRDVIPVMNVHRKDLSLKTEVLFATKKIGLDPGTDLVCRDDVSSSKSGLIESLVLVDHHILTSLKEFRDKIVEIIDHRKLETDIFPGNVNLTHARVGSCSTLIAEKIFHQGEKDVHNFKLGFQLLYSAILTDTHNCSEKFKIVTSRDLSIVERIEALLDFTSTEDRNSIFEEIDRVKKDLSGFTTEELLRRDLKIVRQNDKQIPISAIQMSLMEVASKKDFVDGVFKFQNDNNYDFVVIMGVYKDEQMNPRRSLIIYPSSENVEKFLLKNNDELQLSRSHDIKLENVTYFNQNNPVKTRKTVLPLIQQFLKETIY